MRALKGASLPILYMDFDGVVHHENCLWHPRRGPYLDAPPGYVLFQHSDLLDQMLAPYPAIRIVLSTSWVRQYGCAGAAKRLPRGLRERVLGATFHSAMRIDQSFDGQLRGEQVTCDVLRRAPASWLALDDDAAGWPDWSLPHLVLTDPQEGIGSARVQEELRRKLALLAALQLPVTRQRRRP